MKATQHTHPKLPAETTEEFQTLLSGEVTSRAKTITESTAAFLGTTPAKVFSVLRGVWTVTKGQDPLTDQELLVGMALVARYGLDPFSREIYVTRGKKGLMTILGIDGWIRILDRTDHYDGFDQILVMGDGDEILSVETIIYSKKRSHPARYKAFASDYKKLGGFMLEKIPGHMLRIFSLKHAGRLFVPMGTVVTQEEAAWMQSETDEPAKTLDDLTKEIETPVDVAAEPESNPPTAEEVKADQAQLADEFASELGKADTASRVADLAQGIHEALVVGTLQADTRKGLEELVRAAKEKLSKCSPNRA